ncbi:MAG: GatB/YqeY domain-containing protein [Patescibacteria group bacterium]
MSLLETIEQDFQAAMKSRTATVVSTLRLLKAEIMKKERAGKELKALTEEEVAAAVKGQIKQRQDSIAEYQKAGRADLAEPEEAELKILQKYLPEQLSEAEIEKLVEAAAAEVGTANFGQLMGAVMKKVGGAADGSVVSRLVKNKIV